MAETLAYFKVPSLWEFRLEPLPRNAHRSHPSQAQLHSDPIESPIRASSQRFCSTDLIRDHDLPCPTRNVEIADETLFVMRRRRFGVSITYRVDPVQKVIHTTFEGEVTDEQFLKHARDIESDPNIDGPFVELVQAQTTSMAGVTSAGVRKTAHALQASKALHKVAIVVSREIEYGLGRMVSLLTDESHLEIRVFREQADARSWLGIG